MNVPKSRLRVLAVYCLGARSVHYPWNGKVIGERASVQPPSCKILTQAGGGQGRRLPPFPGARQGVLPKNT